MNDYRLEKSDSRTFGTIFKDAILDAYTVYDSAKLSDDIINLKPKDYIESEEKNAEKKKFSLNISARSLAIIILSIIVVIIFTIVIIQRIILILKKSNKDKEEK